jgi:hypothetical protein
MSDLSFSAVPYEVVDLVWPDVAPMLERAVETASGAYDLRYVKDEIDARRLGLWVALEGTTPVAAITTRIAELPGKRIIAMDWIAGSRMSEWLPTAQKVLQDYAAAHGCSEMHGAGRKGWEKPLGKLGWTAERVMYKLEVPHGQG